MDEQNEIREDDRVIQEAETQAAESSTILTRSREEEVALLEALLLAYGDPMPLGKVQEVFQSSKKEMLGIVDRLQESCLSDARGIEVVVVGEKLQLRTKAAFAEEIRQVMAVKPRRLSQAALETLSVVAYRQPIVKSEIDKIRGVDVSPTLKTLSERQLVKIIGYQTSVGQPALYGTTDDFLKVFGLPSLSSLPAIQDLKALISEPGEAQVESDGEQESDEETSVESHSTETEPAVEIQ